MKLNSKNDYDINIITSINDIEIIREFWEKNQYHPLADIDFYLTIIKARKDITNPYIIKIMEDKIIVGLLIGRIDKTKFSFKIGYKQLFTKKVKQLTVLYGGILGDYTHETFKIVLQRIKKDFNKKKYNLISFEYLNIKDIAFNSITTTLAHTNRNKQLKFYKHYTLSIPEEMNKFYKTKHRRDRLKRIIRKLENEYPEKIAYKKFTNLEDINKICLDAESISQKTYHRGIGAGFIDNNENRQRLTLSAEKGWLMAYILYIEERPVAFWFGTYYNDVLYLDFTGYSQEFYKYEIGTVLFLKMIEDLCNNNVKKIDYGYGDAIYKQRFSDHQWEEAPVYIFPSSFTGLLFKLSKDFEILATDFLKSVFSKINIKKEWRKRILKKKLKNQKESTNKVL